MEVVDGVPGPAGAGPIYLAYLDDVSAWRSLLDDPNWRDTVGDPDRPFTLFTASGDPQGNDGWDDLADYCVQHDVVLVCSWGPNSTVLDDTFDMAAVMREVHDLPASEPATTWHDNEPLTEALDFFLNFNVGRSNPNARDREWDRVVLVVGMPDLSNQVREHLQSVIRPISRTDS